MFHFSVLFDKTFFFQCVTSHDPICTSSAMSTMFVKLPHDSRPCVCSICICGRHNCPGLRCMQPLGGTSHYRDTYTPKKGEREPSGNVRAPPIQIKALPGHFRTTYQTSNEPILTIPHDRVTPYKPQPTVTATAPFDGRTTQRVDFPGHIPSLPPRPPVQHALPKVPGTYDTTLGAMQQPVLDAVRSGTALRSQSATRKAQPIPHLPFDGNTSYKVHFPPKQAEPPQHLSPRSASAGVKENRDFLSTKSASYPAPPLPVRPVCPASLVPLGRPVSRDGHIKVVEPQQAAA